MLWVLCRCREVACDRSNVCSGCYAGGVFAVGVGLFTSTIINLIHIAEADLGRVLPPQSNLCTPADSHAGGLTWLAVG